jgi:hypothetical protein
MAKFGFSKLNSNLNRNQNNNYTFNLASEIDNSLIPVRVLGIILNESHPLFEYYGGWSALGAIQYELITQPFSYKDIESNTNIPIAYPSSPNIKNYPLINEIVYLISLPNSSLKKGNTSNPGIGENPNSKISYYINLTSLWNHPHHNAYPSNADTPNPSQQKSYLQAEAGSPSVVSNDPTQIYLGKTFKERSNIHPLLPFEGDVIHEGRWGNSIRLGSTVKNTNNDWSSVGENGDPIIIIRNGQGSSFSPTQESGWNPIVENINKNNSSIYLTSTQNIPLNASSVSYISYPNGQQPITPNKYAGPQILLDSGRLVFNTYGDHILLSSATSINLNSQDTVNIDTRKFITQADKIFLGKEELATEPLLLGNTTVDMLKNIISSLKEIAQSLQYLISDPVAPGAPATFAQMQIPMTAVLMTMESLEKQLGTSPETCTITSKRNFTL